MFDVRPCATDEEFAGAFMAIGQYFGAEPTPDRTERFLKLLELGRMHAARQDERRRSCLSCSSPATVAR